MTRARSLADELTPLPLTRAYLFGSQAEGRTGPLSDVDVAILPAEGIGGRDRLLLQGRVADVAAAIFGTDRADVVLLDEAPPSLAFAAVRGRLLLDHRPQERVAFEARVMAAFHDRRHHEAQWARATLDRYAKGGFASRSS